MRVDDVHAGRKRRRKIGTGSAPLKTVDAEDAEEGDEDAEGSVPDPEEAIGFAAKTT